MHVSTKIFIFSLAFSFHLLVCYMRLHHPVFFVPLSPYPQKLQSRISQCTEYMTPHRLRRPCSLSLCVKGSGSP